MRELLFKVEKVLGGALLALLSATILIQVVSRFLFNLPLAWSEELSRYSFIWLTMIVAPVCVRQNANLGMDMLVHRLPERGRLALSIVSYALVSILLAVMLVWGTIILQVVSAQRSPALGIPMFWVYLAVPVGAGLTLIELVIFLLEEVKKLTATMAMVK